VTKIVSRQKVFSAERRLGKGV